MEIQFHRTSKYLDFCAKEHYSDAIYRQGIIQGIKRELTAKNPDYQLGWAILAECTQLDDNFNFMLRKISQPYLLNKIMGTQ